MGLGRGFLRLLALVSPLASASGGKPPAKLDPPTAFQSACRQLASERGPLTVAFGFDGLWAYDDETYRKLKSGEIIPDPADDGARGQGHLLWGMIARGLMQVPGEREWYYFDQASLDRKRLSDPFRCAYEWAKARYAPAVGSPDKGERRNRIVLLGFSFGGFAASELAKQLDDHGLAVDAIITADPRPRSGPRNFSKGPNVASWANFFQTNTPFLNGYGVEGASPDLDLSRRGYGHTDLPASEEVVSFVRDAFRSP